MCRVQSAYPCSTSHSGNAAGSFTAISALREIGTRRSAHSQQWWQLQCLYHRRPERQCARGTLPLQHGRAASRHTRCRGRQRGAQSACGLSLAWRGAAWNTTQRLVSAAVRSSATLILFSMLSRELSLREDDGRTARAAALGGLAGGMGWGVLGVLPATAAAVRLLPTWGLAKGLAEKKEATLAASAGEMEGPAAAARGAGTWCRGAAHTGVPGRGEALQGKAAGLGETGSARAGRAALEGAMATPLIAAHSDARGVTGCCCMAEGRSHSPRQHRR